MPVKSFFVDFDVLFPFLFPFGWWKFEKHNATCSKLMRHPKYFVVIRYCQPLHSRILSNTLTLSFCGANTEWVFAIVLSGGVSIQGLTCCVGIVAWVGSVVVFPSMRERTCTPFSVKRKYFSASWVKAACFLFFRNRSNASMIAGS